MHAQTINTYGHTVSAATIANLMFRKIRKTSIKKFRSAFDKQATLRALVCSVDLWAQLFKLANFIRVCVLLYENEQRRKKKNWQ